MPKELNVSCPGCGEISPAGSVNCMHCGRSFKGDSEKSADGPPAGLASAFGWSFNPIHGVLAAVGVIAVYVLLFVLFTHPLYLPMRRLIFACFSLSLSTASLIFVDAENLGTKLDVEGLPEMTALHWFLLTLLLWPVGFGLYMLARAQFGEVRLSRLALASGAGLLGLMVVACVVIEIRSSLFFRSALPRVVQDVRVNGQPIQGTATAAAGSKSPVIVISSGTQVIRR